MAEAKTKVLVADDDGAIRALLLRVLDKFGFIPFEARTGDEVISVLDKRPDISIVLMVWMMSGNESLETLRAVRKLPKAPKVIMMTAKTGREDVLAAIDAGASDYLAKPLNIGRLVLKLNTLSATMLSRDTAVMQAVPKLELEAGVTLPVIDISATGCAVLSPFPLDPGAVLFLDSRDLTKYFDLQEERNFPVRVANCEAKGPRYKLGVQFIMPIEAEQ